MKKVILILMFAAMTSPAFAEGFVKSEADRSGATGTLNMIGNSISGFFGNLSCPFKGKKAESSVRT
jgi:hypothetical protein